MNIMPQITSETTGHELYLMLEKEIKKINPLADFVTFENGAIKGLKVGIVTPQSIQADPHRGIVELMPSAEKIGSGLLVVDFGPRLKSSRN
mgnify:CR=1 FL=1